MVHIIKNKNWEEKVNKTREEKNKININFFAP